MKDIITLCARRPVTMIMLILAMFIGAFHSINVLPLDKLPEIILPKVTVETAYPGMGATEIRRSVTIPLEDALSAVRGLDGIRSVSRDGSSLVILSFRWGTSPARAAALTREAIDTIYPGLPQGVSKPIVISGDPSDKPHAIVAVRSLTGDNNFARNFAEYELRSRLRRLDGAGRVSVSGGNTQEIHVRADNARLAALSLAGNDLAGMIAYETADFPAGSAKEDSRELTVVSSGRPRSEEELAALILSSQSGPLKLADIAGTTKENSPQQSLFIFENMEQTALEVYRRSSANPVRLSRDIKKIVEESSDLFSRDMEIKIVFDSSPSIVSGIKSLLISAVLASLAVILVLTLFMGRLSCSLLAALALPVSISAALIALAATGRSLNSMSLGGLALGIGLVSDVSVIVLDLFSRQHSASREVPSADEAGRLAASVSLSSMAGALTTVVVFLPIIFLPGPLGALFGDLALSMIVSVLAGWFYAQFCLPSLYCFLMTHTQNSDSRHSRDSWLIKFGTISKHSEKLYSHFLKKVLRYPVPIIGISLLASLLGFSLLLFRPMEFIASDAVSEIEVTVDFPFGTTLEGAVDYGIEISKTISQLHGFSSFYGRMGAEPDDTSLRADPDYRRERLLFRCFVKNPGKGEDTITMVRTALDGFSSSAISNAPAISVAASGDRGNAILGLSPVLTLAVKGNTPEEAYAMAEEAAAALKREAGSSLNSFSLRPSGTRPQLRLVPRREQLASLGLSLSQVAASVYAASEGVITGNIEIEGRPVDIRVSGSVYGNDPALLKNLLLPASSARNRNNSTVFLSSLVDIEWVEAETALARLDRSDVIYLDIFPTVAEEKNIRAFLNRISNHISRADESVFTRYRSALIATLILVLILLYLTLGAQFESFLLPLILMLAVPFSLAGAGPALFLSGSSMDSGAVLGLVALFGLSVNNGIVLYEISANKIRRNVSHKMAVYSGSVERFRPVLLTTLTTIFALLPLVLSPLGNSQRSMAFTMLGGIVAAGFLAFFALPPVFIRYLGYKGRHQ